MAGTGDEADRPEDRFHIEDCQEVLINKRKVVLPPELPGWSTHTQAIANLEERGWTEARFCPDFTASNLCSAVSKHTKKDVAFVDMTRLVPSGPNASHSSFPTIGFDVAKRSQGTTDKAYVLMRNQSNTPAYLGGVFYGYCAQLGSPELARAETHLLATPGAHVFFDGRTFVVPTTVLQGTADLAGRAVAAMIDENAASFCCSICGQSFLTITEEQVHFNSTMLAADCNHPYHPHCIMAYLRKGQTGCPVCSSLLPVAWRPRSRKVEPSASKQQARARANEKDINEAARKVRQAMQLDGLQHPDDVERIPDPGRPRPAERPPPPRDPEPATDR